jgi:hypothetical protein
MGAGRVVKGLNPKEDTEEAQNLGSGVQRGTETRPP